MALRDQPYLPLYVQDYLTDEKLNMCSTATQGIYIKIMCLMHKSEQYGKILLRQKFQQHDNICLNLASQLVKNLPFSQEEIYAALCELTTEGVCYIENGSLCQKRMIRDNYISEQRAKAGSKGGIKTRFARAKNIANEQANNIANTEYEYENENEYENDLSKGGKGGKRSARFKPPTQQEVETYLSLKGQFKAEELTMLATRFINFYESKNWFVGKNKMTNWKAAATNSLAWDRSFARSTSQSQQRGTSIVQVQEIFNELNGKQ